MAAMIRQTKEWWRNRLPAYEAYVAERVLSGAARGDPEAGRRRLARLKGLPVLITTDAALELADSFLRHFALPPNAADDALHIAVAAAAHRDYLLTWNCRHIANAALRPKLEALCLSAGQRCPIICTPPELMEQRL